MSFFLTSSFRISKISMHRVLFFFFFSYISYLFFHSFRSHIHFNAICVCCLFIKTQYAHNVSCGNAFPEISFTDAFYSDCLTRVKTRNSRHITKSFDKEFVTRLFSDEVINSSMLFKTCI